MGHLNRTVYHSPIRFSCRTSSSSQVQAPNEPFTLMCIMWSGAARSNTRLTTQVLAESTNTAHRVYSVCGCMLCTASNTKITCMSCTTVKRMSYLKCLKQKIANSVNHSQLTVSTCNLFLSILLFTTFSHFS